MSLILACFWGTRSIERFSVADSPDTGHQHALLIGCTKYLNLPSTKYLAGPANDVELMARLLIDRFGFQASEIVKLSETQPDSRYRPRRKNIEREIERLAQRAAKGDMVVILLAGHGAQQPDDDSDDPQDVELDGLDELFLPSDIGSWNGKVGKVENAITDDEICQWLVSIRRKGAFVWLIVDSCHSGTISRGMEVSRELAPGELVPVAVIDRARRTAAARRTGQTAGASERPDEAELAGIVALYAAQSYETAPEKPLPENDAGRKSYGLLTYTLCQVLEQARSPMTYQELVERIYQEYMRRGRAAPTPLLEGTDLNREVLGNWIGHAHLLLRVAASGRMTVSAGALHGLTRGSVLRVLPPAGAEAADRALGYVSVTNAGPLKSDVVPKAYDARPAPTSLPSGARCEVVFVDYGDRRLKVAVAPTGIDGHAVPPEDRQRVVAALEAISQSDEGSLIQYVSAIDRAQWVVRIGAQKIRLEQVAGGPSLARSGPRQLGSGSFSSDWTGWLETSLRRIAKATSLLSLAQPEHRGLISGLGGVDVGLQMVRFDPDMQHSHPITWNNGRIVRDGQIVGFEVHNRGFDPVDVTLLLVDSQYGITSLFALSVGTNNRIDPEKRCIVARARAEAAPAPEHLLMIAVRVQRQHQPANFAWLAQPSIERSRSQRAGPPSPLEQLLENRAFAEGHTRGLNTQVVRDYQMKMLSWRTVSSSENP